MVSGSHNRRSKSVESLMMLGEQSQGVSQGHCSQTRSTFSIQEQIKCMSLQQIDSDHLCKFSRDAINDNV